MHLAHTPLVPGGPGVWLLILAAVLLGMAVYLFATKGPPRTVLLLVLVSIAIGIGSVAAPDVGPDVHLAIEAPRDGATVVAGEEIEVRVALSGGRLSSSSDDPASGHLHVLVDGEVVSMVGALVTHVTLSPGDHTIEAEFVAPDHRPLSPRVVARADVTARSRS